MYYMRGDILWAPALLVGVTDVIGAYAGSKLSLKTKSKWLRAGLAIIVFTLACTVLYKELF